MAGFLVHTFRGRRPEKTAAKFDLSVDEVKKASNGIVYANPDISKAALADMFESLTPS